MQWYELNNTMILKRVRVPNFWSEVYLRGNVHYHALWINLDNDWCLAEDVPVSIIDIGKIKIKNSAHSNARAPPNGIESSSFIASQNIYNKATVSTTNWPLKRILCSQSVCIEISHQLCRRR